MIDQAELDEIAQWTDGMLTKNLAWQRQKWPEGMKGIGQCPHPSRGNWYCEACIVAEMVRRGMDVPKGAKRT